VLPDGQICYRLKRPIADGRTELLLAPTEFLPKLASLIPPPRHHLVRFQGVFAPNAAWRKEVVPSLEQARTAGLQRTYGDCALPRGGFLIRGSASSAIDRASASSYGAAGAQAPARWLSLTG